MQKAVCDQAVCEHAEGRRIQDEELVPHEVGEDDWQALARVFRASGVRSAASMHSRSCCRLKRVVPCM